MGVRTGNPRGRPKGSPNKATVERQEAVQASGKTPLDFMLDAMRDPGKTFEQQFEAAKSAAPYVHPRLAATQITGDLTVTEVSDQPQPSEAEWAAQHAQT